MYGVAPPACDERQYDARSSAALCTGAESNLRDRALGEIGKNNSFARQSGQTRFMPSNHVSQLGEDREKFSSNFSKRA